MLSKNQQNAYLGSNQEIDLDLANFNHLVQPGGHDTCNFTSFINEMAERLTSKLPESENPLKKYAIGFYLQDREDSSPARISSSKYRMDAADLNGSSFAIILNKEKLSRIQSEDELAFIVGHELSHLGWQHNNENVRGLSQNEEAACDLNSLRMMNDGGYDVSVVSNMDCDCPLTEEWQQRKKERQNKVMEFFDFRRPTALDTKPWQDAKYVKWTHDFKTLGADIEEKDAIAAIRDNLQKVFAKGGQDECLSQLKDYIASKGTEQGSKFFLHLTADVMQNFPPIDEVKRSGDYRTFLRHPVNVLGNAAFGVATMSGKKLYPPEACSQINTYFKSNPDYYRSGEVLWKKAICPEKSTIGFSCERG